MSFGILNELLKEYARSYVTLVLFNTPSMLTAHGENNYCKQNHMLKIILCVSVFGLPPSIFLPGKPQD